MHGCRTPFFIVALLVAAGCANDDPDPGDAATKVFENVSVATRSVYREKTNAGWLWRVSVTDATGVRGCASAATPSTARDAGTHEVLLTFVNEVSQWPGSCGSYLSFSVDGCPTQAVDWSHPPLGCAYYRRWDEAAMLVDVQPAAFGSLLLDGTCGGNAGEDIAQSFDVTYHLALRFDLDAGDEHFDDYIRDSSSGGSDFCM